MNIIYGKCQEKNRSVRNEVKDYRVCSPLAYNGLISYAIIIGTSYQWNVELLCLFFRLGISCL